MSEETLFHEALAQPPAERAAFLDAACAGQPQLRAAVAALLAAYDASGSFMDPPALSLISTAVSDPGKPRGRNTGDFTPESEPGQLPLVQTTDHHPQTEPGLEIAGR